MKLNSSGLVQWVRQLGADTQTSSVHVLNATGHDTCDGVALDSSGNVYCAGYTNNSLGETHGGGWGSDAFIMKLNSSGGIQWIRQLGQDTEASSAQVLDTSGGDGCYSIAVDGSGNIYCGGDTQRMKESSGQWEWDPMVIKLNSSGEVQWVRHFGSVTLSNPDYLGGMIRGIAVDANGSVYGSGEIYGYADEAEGGGENGDVYIFKLNPDGTLDL